MESSPGEGTKVSYLRIPGVAALILIGIILVIIVTLYIVASNPPNEYILFFDAGSTSTKLHLFKFQDYPFRSNGWVSEVAFKKITPPIANFGTNPRGVTDNLLTAIDEITDVYIPSGKRASINLKATAGMRLLQLNNPIQADDILEQLRFGFQKSRAKVINEFSDIRIIDGKTEAQMSWIAINYLLKNFGDDTGKKPVPEDKLVGVLDLGGASTQIAFIPMDHSSIPRIIPMEIFGIFYNVYYHSFLCYGKQISELRYLAGLYAAITPPLPEKISSPCHLNGYTFQKNSDEIFTKPCVTSEYATMLTGVAYSPPPTSLNLTFEGTGDPDSCRLAIANLFNKIPCYSKSCSFNNINQPEVNGRFIAVSAFYYTIEGLGLYSAGGKITRQQLAEKTGKFCRKHWTEVQSESTASELIFKSGFCFDGVYVDRLLRGYGFETSDSWRNIEFVEEINGAVASWALGSAVEFTRHIDSTSPKIFMDRIAFFVCVALLVVIFLVLCLLMLCLTCRSRGNKQLIDLVDI